MKKHLFTLSFLIVLLIIPSGLSAREDYKIEKDISYIPATETDPYRLERCKLDIYYPAAAANKTFPTVVWFHGGGLEGGSKFFPRELMDQGIAIISVNYRLSPLAIHPAYIQDAAQAVAWAFENIGKYGGSTQDIIVSGHSAGGYLSLMLALDTTYLARHHVEADNVLAWFPLSGQTATHYTIRKEHGLSKDIPLIDAFAPLHHARKDTPPIYLITGDRHLEMTARYEENAYLAALLKAAGNNNVYLYELQGFDHGNMYTAGCQLIVEYLKKRLRN